MKAVAIAGVAATKRAAAEDSKFSSLRDFVAKSWGNNPVFRTDANGLWELYLSMLPTRVRQEHNCHECRRFIESYGGLVTIEPSGKTTAYAWQGLETEAPVLYRKAIAALRGLVESANVTGVFKHQADQLGVHKTPPWTHLYIRNSKWSKDIPRTENPNQTEARKHHEFENVLGALSQVEKKELDAVNGLLESDALYRSEAIRGPFLFLYQLFNQIGKKKGKIRTNLIWRAVAEAPTGFCHPRASVWWPLLEDIDAGTPVKSAIAKFKERMSPLQYQRPQAPPKEGAIDQAEKLVDKLKLRPSLDRRTLDWELDTFPCLWKPKAEKKTSAKAKGKGAFAHLRDGAEEDLSRDAPAYTTMTWVKFRDNVMPSALSIEVKPDAKRQPWHGLCTAVRKKDPPIIRWDSAKKRNPVSWYAYAHGSYATDFGTASGCRRAVLGILDLPCHWHRPQENVGSGVIFAVSGAEDNGQPGLCLFPEVVSPDLHSVRSVIEAHSRGQGLQKTAHPVCGIAVRQAAGSTMPPISLIVRTPTVTRAIQIDRWD